MHEGGKDAPRHIPLTPHTGVQQDNIYTTSGLVWDPLKISTLLSHAPLEMWPDTNIQKKANYDEMLIVRFSRIAASLSHHKLKRLRDFVVSNEIFSGLLGKVYLAYFDKN